MVKRKAQHSSPLSSSPKKGKITLPTPPLSNHEIEQSFRNGLFDDSVKSEYNKKYQASGPYKHGVIESLMDDTLLLSVKNEILENLHFTPKETDIYRIHQSGDLANISGLPEHLAAKLPSIRRLRDALYSQKFRDYVCAVTGCGALSGQKTDMAINVYTPGCHLLTHDDVIGSRRVSYILYLCGSPTEPWQDSWGGALRLYPTTIASDGKTKVPEAQWSKIIPPSFNQLSFFEVVPGESFHDVEEVYDGAEGEERIRMAISGWFHIPQNGEDGYIKGFEEELAKKSSLQSLQSKADQFDRPQPQIIPYPTAETPEPKELADNGKGKGKASAPPEDDVDEDTFSTTDLDFLLKYISPVYLTPNTLEQMTSEFVENSLIKVSDFLHPKFAAKLREYVEAQEAAGHKASTWPVAVPPHKQKFLYLQPSSAGPAERSPIDELINDLLPSPQFQKLLQIATGMKITSRNILARRFRKGSDYTLATSMPETGPDEEDPMQLEICLGMTPTLGWGDDDDEVAATTGPETSAAGGIATAESSSAAAAAAAVTAPSVPTSAASRKKSRPVVPNKPSKFDDTDRTFGGYEMYMGQDEDGGDAAVYKAAAVDDGDDGILFTNPASWNELSIVLRDAGTLRFVKYVSAKAQGDRWDVMVEFGIEEAEEAVSGDEGASGDSGDEESLDDEEGDLDEMDED